MNPQTVVVAFGGVSPEHEVSVLTAMQAFAALSEERSLRLLPLYVSKAGHWYTGDRLKELSGYEDVDRTLKQASPCTFARSHHGRPVLRTERSGLFSRPEEHVIDVVLLAFHGSDGENGAFQGLCESWRIPYTGCNVLSSALGMDKVTAKAVCRAHQIPVVDEHSFYESEWEQDQAKIVESAEALGYPLIVKPVHLGSSIGVARAEDRDQLITHIEMAFRYDDQLLVEKAVTPLMEINCSVLGSTTDCRASVCERPLGSEELLSFRDKYQSDEGESKGMASAAREIPADISEELTRGIQETSRRIFTIFKASGVARLDFLVNADTGEYFFNEINTIPGSFSFYLWDHSGTDFRSLLLELIDLALARHRQKTGRIQSYDTNLLSQKAVKGLKGLKGSK